MNAPLLALALAAGPEILLPPWPISADGDLVAVRGDAPLTAEGGTTERIAPGLFRVLPDEGAGEVRLSAGGASTTARCAPPPAVIEIAIRPAAPVKGRDSIAQVELTVRGPSGEPDVEARPPEIAASTGRIRDLSPAGPGRFRAVYEIATTRHPEVAVLLAVSPRCPLCATPRAAGYAIVPLAAAIDLPGHSEPGTRTTLTVGGRTFGPATADARGRFSIPIVVPPGAHLGAGDSVDQLGNRKRTEVDLRLPPIDRLACAGWPRALPADGRSFSAIWCVGSTASGAPAPDARLRLSASSGDVTPLAPFRGALQRARFRAPAGGGGWDAVLSAAYPDGGAASADTIRIALATGAPAEISAKVEREPVPLGASVPAEVLVRDGNGDVVGRASGPPGAKEGFVSPDRFVARAVPGDFVQQAPVAFALAPGPDVARLSLRRRGAEWLAEARTVDARPAAAVLLGFGPGAAARTDARGEARNPAAGPAGAVIAANGARAAGWQGIEPPAAPFEIARTVAVALRPPSPVDVIATVEGGMLRWRVEDAGGRVLPGRRVTLRAGAVDLGPAEQDGDGGRASIRGGRGTVAVVDAESGAAAIVEVR